MARSVSDRKIESQLRRYILDELAGVGDRSLDADAPLFESLLDSTSVLALVSHLETYYGIVIDDHEVVPSQFGTLRRLAGFVVRKQAPRAHPVGAA